MNGRLYFMAAFVFKITASQNFTHSTLLGTEQSLTLTCETDDLSKAILFKLGTDNKGGCIAVGSCHTGINGYETPVQQGAAITKMTITSCNETRDIGSWTCTYGGSTSEPVMITTCSEDTTTTAHIVSTNTTTDNDNSDGKAIGIVIGILTGIVVITCIIVIVMVAKRLSIRSTGETSGNCFLTFCQFIEDKFFDCCGNKNSKKYWLLGYGYLVLYGVIVGLIVLPAVYYGFDGFQEGLVIGVGFVIVLVLSGLCLLVVWMLKKFFNNDASKNFRLECCISLMSDTVTPHDRQQPDGDEGIKSTPTEIHTRLSTPPRPLPPRPDIASKPQGTLDSLNSHIPIVLPHIENSNIPPSINTLDEQKTDKKPTDKKKKKKKKKKKDVEQDNPGTG